MMLFNAMPIDKRYIFWKNQKVCTIQKEYPTARSLGKPRRQNWDIAVIKNPPHSNKKSQSYDYLRLSAVLEFGLNEPEEHLIGDIERLCHINSNVDQGFIIQLYRLSEPGAQFSARDWSPNSARILTKENVAQLAAEKPIEILYALFDSTGRYTSGLWLIKRGNATSIGSI
jgi:hypothetical protein